jgi:beta-phosphoglucomutase-like phosphatase (HAD superfamily)
VPAAACAGVEDSSNGIRAAAAAGLTVVAIPNPVYPPQSDALALCAKIAASPDDARRFLEERLGAPGADRNGEARRNEPSVVRSSGR